METGTEKVNTISFLEMVFLDIQKKKKLLCISHKFVQFPYTVIYRSGMCFVYTSAEKTGFDEYSPHKNTNMKKKKRANAYTKNKEKYCKYTNKLIEMIYTKLKLIHFLLQTFFFFSSCSFSLSLSTLPLRIIRIQCMILFAHLLIYSLYSPYCVHTQHIQQ